MNANKNVWVSQTSVDRVEKFNKKNQPPPTICRFHPSINCCRLFYVANVFFFIPKLTHALEEETMLGWPIVLVFLAQQSQAMADLTKTKWWFQCHTKITDIIQHFVNERMGQPPRQILLLCYFDVHWALLVSSWFGTLICQLGYGESDKNWWFRQHHKYWKVSTKQTSKHTVIKKDEKRF